MIRSLMPKKELLLAVVPGEDGEAAIRHARIDGRRILAVGDGVPADISGSTRVSLYSPDSYFEQVDLAAASLKLLPLVARRHVDAELVFDDASYRLRARSRSKRERTIAADLSAFPESDLEAAVSLLPLQQRPCMQMAPLELAIAALVGKVTAEPVIVFWEKGGVLVSLLVAGGMVQNRMRERVTDADRDIIMGRAEAGMRASASRAAESREISVVLHTGELRGKDDDSSDKAVAALEKKLTGLYRGKRSVPADAVLFDPELYGLPFVDAEWNFLEAAYRNQVQSWYLARPAAAAAGLAGICIALYGGMQHLRALDMASDFDSRRAALSASLAEFERIRPSDQEIASVRNRLQVQRQSLSEVRLDRMLEWLTHLVPEGVVIRSLKVAPVPLQRQRRSTTLIEYPPGEKPFDVNMEIMLAETALDNAEAKAAEVVRRLSQRLSMVDSRLDVPAPEPGVRRNVVLMVQAQAQAVNFL